ncbi:MAG: calcium-binding protein [Elusimicrobiota bacterium]
MSIKKNYFDSLKRKLKFPINAEIYAMENYKTLKNGDRVKIISLSYEDDLYGIICDLRFGRKKYSIPLVELKVDKTSPAYGLIREYQVAFGSR